MNPLYIWMPMIVAIVALSVTCVILSRIVFKYRHDHKVHVQHRKQNMLEDLELATSEQLMGELRKRTGFPYLLLSPIENEDNKGISIEIHNIQPIPCLQMLTIATSMTAHELKRNGVELPDGFPGFMPEGSEEDGEEWKQPE